MLSVNTYKKKELHMKLRRRKLVNGNFSPFKLLMFWFFKARRVFIGHFKNKINPNQAKKSEDQNTFIPHPPSYKKKKKRGRKEKRKMQKKQRALKVCHVSHRNLPYKNSYSCWQRYNVMCAAALFMMPENLTQLKCLMMWNVLNKPSYDHWK